MSEIINEIKCDQEKLVDFIFQDETRIKISVSFLNHYPESLLSLIYLNKANYLKDEDAYFVDSPTLHIDRIVLYMENELSLDTLSLTDILDIYSGLKHFFASSFLEYQMKIYDYLILSMQKIIEQNECEINYGDLFEFDKEKELTINNDFDDRIPYEYIYPSNLHELFPSMNQYKINVSYYPQKQTIQIDSKEYDNNEYHYNEYSRSYYSQHYPESFENYKNEHEEMAFNHSFMNKDDNKEDNKEEIIPLNTNNEIHSLKEEEKSYLYYEIDDDYSREYNEKQKELEKNDADIKKKKKTISYIFYYINNENIRDILHPILEYLSDECYEIFNYILNMPICKQIQEIKTKSRQKEIINLEMHPLLRALKNGIFDHIYIFNILNYIQSKFYSKYQNLIQEIISTHIFDNVTTLEINGDHTDQCDIEFQIELLHFFTKTHFPKLSIYDLSNYYCCCPYDIQSRLAKYLVPYSLLELIDIIYIKHSNLYKNTFPINVESLETIFQVKKHHDITIQSYIIIDKFDELMKRVLYSGLLIDYEVYFDFDDISESLSDYSLIDLNLYPSKFIDVEANSTDYSILHRMEYIYERINCDHLEAISIHLIDIIDEKINEYYNEYLSFLSTCNYTTVNKLTIDKHQAYFSLFETPNLQYIKEINDVFYKFFSLFTNNIQYIYISDSILAKYLLFSKDTIQLPLWSNLQELYLYFNDTIESLSLTLFNELDKRQLNNLKIVSILCPCSISFDVTHIYTFIDSFKNASSSSFQNLNTFKISIKLMFGDNTIDIHLLESFPSFSFYLHKPITSIIMCKDICCFGNSIHSYENYIYNQLNSKYSKNIQYLEISSFDFNEEVTLLQSYNDTHLFYCEIIQCRLQDDDY
ncbi:hypothetical protein WA158_004768 [Blastocystis sp. Blastoise]